MDGLSRSGLHVQHSSINQYIDYFIYYIYIYTRIHIMTPINPKYLRTISWTNGVRDNKNFQADSQRATTNKELD